MKVIKNFAKYISLAFVVLLFSACALMSVYAKNSCQNGVCELKAGKMLVTYQKTASDRLKMTMSASTNGWVAIGFGASYAMKDAYMVIGYIDHDGRVQLSEEYGTGVWSHQSIKSLGGKNQVTNIAGNYDKKTNTTTISFEMPLKSNDRKYGKVLEKGKEVSVIMAYGNEDAKDFTSHHQFRAKANIQQFPF